MISFRKHVSYSLIASISDGHALIGRLRHIPGNLEVMISETSLNFMRPFLSGCELNARVNIYRSIEETVCPHPSTQLPQDYT